MALHEFLGKGLAALKGRRRSAGPEHRQAPGSQHIGQPFHQGALRPHHRECDLFFFREAGDVLVARQIHALGELGDGIAAGGGIEMRYTRTAGKFPGQRMVPPTATNDEDFHGVL